LLLPQAGAAGFDGVRIDPPIVGWMGWADNGVGVKDNPGAKGCMGCIGCSGGGLPENGAVTIGVGDRDDMGAAGGREML
jgi:hypothetical protein